MYKRLSLPALLLTVALCGSAQKPMKAPAGGKLISDELIGIFFEDINFAADGGINAEMLQNGSFEYNPNERDGWGAGTGWRIARPGHSLGKVEVRQDKPLHPNNPNYMRIYVERVGHYYDSNGWTGYGLINDGFNGMNIKEGAKYDFTLFARNISGEDKPLRIALTKNNTESAPLAEANLTVSGSEWKKYTCTLTASESYPTAFLQILSLTLGEFDVDAMMLVPQDTYKGHGLRRDLIEALEAMRPKFMRFPGGCVVHGGGDGFWNTYRWKTTVGPKEQRLQLKNTWGYHQSMEVGYYEYFQLCEDLNMQPVPILPCGVNCQGSNGGWGMKDQAQDACPMSEMDEWVQDALDLIEWANGDATTKWGKVRAEAGHPEPFGLKYLGLGNEERISPEFEERFKYMYERITQKHPEIVIVGTAGPGSHAGNPDYDNGWRIAEQLNVPILDEHYYEPREYFMNSRQYDKYPRDRKTKVYLGEYASKDKKLIDALAEALYLLHVERNGDVVCMTSYAPLFCRMTNMNWNPDLIYFDNYRVQLTPSYYVQQMFGQSSGQYYYPDCVTIDSPDKSQGEGYLQEQSAILNVKTRQLFIKVANATENAKKAKLNLSRFKGLPSTATKTILVGHPQTNNINNPSPLTPLTSEILMKKDMPLDIPPYSLTMLTIQL